VTIEREELRPSSFRQLAEMMAARNTRAQKISTIDLRLMNRVVELAPEDMTVIVEAGITLGALQRELAAHRQCLPIDPPNAENVSIHEVLSRDLSGPRRFGYGTIREHLIGMKVVLADGRLIKSGGKVVKNVAGYDLAKLFIGSQDSLGIIVEATFKLRPLPEEERFVARQIGAPGEAKPTLASVLNAELTPTVLDTHRAVDAYASRFSIVLGFAGTREEVKWQLNAARELGFEASTNLDYETQFWNNPAPVNRTSVLPSRLMETIAALGPRPFVARAGNGVVYYRGEALSQKNGPPVTLSRRIKTAYDPKNILPELSA
jgi:FAD/FMN-containing dehydrogenase